MDAFGHFSVGKLSNYNGTVNQHAHSDDHCEQHHHIDGLACGIQQNKRGTK